MKTTLSLLLIFFTSYANATDKVFAGVDEKGEPCQITLRYLTGELFGFSLTGQVAYSVPSEKAEPVRINYTFDGNPMRLHELRATPVGTLEGGKITFKGGNLKVVFDVKAKTIEAEETKAAFGPLIAESKRLKCLNVAEVEEVRPVIQTHDISAPVNGRK